MIAKLAMRMVTILLVLMSVCVFRSQAQTAVSWTGSSSGNWNTASDWSSGVVPNNGGGKTYNVTISPGTAQTVSLNLGVTITDLTLGTASGGANATLQSVAGDSLTIAAAGNLTVATTGTLLFSTAGSNITVGSGGTLTNNGNFDLEAAGETLSVTGATTNGAGATLSIEGGSAATFTGNVSNSGTFETGFSGGNNTVNVSGTFTNASGATLNIYGSGDVVNINALSNSGTVTLDSGTTLTLTGGGNGVTDVAAGTTYNVGGTFNVKNGSTTTSALAKVTTLEGTLNMQNGQANTITPTGGTLKIASGGSLNLSNATATTTTVSVAGNVSNSGEVVTGFSGGTNTVNVSGTFTNAAGAEMILYSPTDTVNVNALSNSGVLQIGDAPGSGATLTITGGGKGVTDVVAGSTLNLFGSLKVKNGSTITNGLASLTSVEGTLDLNNGQTTSVTPVGGTFTIASGGLITLSNSAAATTTLSITGSVSNSGEITTGFSGGTNTVNVSGTFTNATSSSELILYSTTDAVNVNALSNSGFIEIGTSPGTDATLTITGGGKGVTNIVAGSLIELYGSLNVKNGSTTTSALGSLTSVEGTLDLENNQTTGVTPGGGMLTIANGGLLELSGTAASTTTLSITGSVNNSGSFTTGFEGGANTVTVTGTFTNNAGGLLEVYGGGGEGVGTDLVNIATLSNAGTVYLAGTGSTLDITGAGTLNNSGAIELTQGILKFNAASASLTGGGTVTLGNSGGTATGVIQVGSTDTGTLTNTNNTITGYGNVGNGTLTLVNKGTIDANGQTTSGALTVQPGTGGLTNTGTLEATNQGTLVLEGRITNTGGTIEAQGENGATASSTVQLVAGTTVTGGTLTTTTVSTNSGIIEGTGAVTLNGVTNSGTYAVNAGTTTTLRGAVTNTGSITLTGSTLSMGNSVTLNGAGTVDLSNSASNLITGAGSGLTLTTANTIEGAGTISNLGIVNTGNIEANQSTPLIVLPSSSGLNNQGTLTVATGDTMQVGTSAGGALLNLSGTTLTGGTYAVSGTLQFGASGTSVVTDAANISLTGTAAKIIDFAGQNVLTDLSSITSAGSFSLSSGAAFTTVGNFTNSGKLTVNAGSRFTVKGLLNNFNSSTHTLTGGSYTVGGKLNFAGADIVTDAANITLDGTGEIMNATNSSNGMTDLATITAAGSFTLGNKAAFTTVGNLTDNGKLTVNAGSTLTIAGTLTNFNSSTDTLANGTYTIGGTVEFTGANIVNNAANLTISGSTAKILNGTTNGLANFSNNAGSFNVTGNGSFTTGSAAFTNSGAVTVTKGSTLTVGGGNSYNQSAGTTTVDGTLSAFDTGINVTGGNILGAGKLNSSVTVGGSGTAPTISVGDSGKAGLLAITGNYTQLSTATMNSFIGGAAAGTQFSQLQVTSTASLAGTLTVTLASGFTPAIGSTFTVLTAGAITGTFSDSTIAINSSEHFAVSYTSTGVVLTVVSGAAPQSNGLAQSSLTALQAKQSHVAISGLRRSVSATTHGNYILVAGKENLRPRSGAILARGSGLSRFEDSNLLPGEMAIWKHMPSVAAPSRPQPSAERLNQNVPQSNNRNEPSHAASGMRIAVTETFTRRQPVKIFTPMFPRLGR